MGLSKDSYILEIGCGYGRELFQFAKISTHIYGIDISETHAALTKKNVPSAETKSYDGKTLPYSDNSFDFVYSCFVMQHMSKASGLELMKEMFRVLRPKGKVLLEFFSADDLNSKEGEDRMSGGETGMYNNIFTLNEIIKMSNGSGFKWQFVHTKNLEIGGGPTMKNLWLYAIKEA